MKDRKRRLETFSFYDRTGLERHLAEQARQGWLLEKIGQFLWTYRRIEPKSLTFSVCYFPKASQFDPEPSVEQQTFYDFCAHTGWELAAANAQLQVFYNERENPVPIETDPALEVEAIHRTMKRSLLPSQLLLLAVALLDMAMFVWRLTDDPIGMLSSTPNLFTGLCWVLLLVLIGTELSSYFRWHRKAVLAAHRGEFWETGSHHTLQIAALVLLLLGLIVYFLTIAVSESRMMAVVSILIFCVYCPGLFLLVWGVREWLKRWETPAKVNMVVTFISVFVAASAVVGVITYGALSGMRHGWLDGEQETYEYQGRTYTLDRDPLPLALEDLLEGDFSHYDRRKQTSWTPLLARDTVHQWPIGPVELFPKPVYLDYEVILVKAPFLYDLCREAKLHERDDWYEELPEEERNYYAPIDPAPWGAQEAYQWAAPDMPDWVSNQFLLFYPDRVVEICMDWDEEPTPEQMALVGERLGG